MQETNTADNIDDCVLLIEFSDIDDLLTCWVLPQRIWVNSIGKLSLHNNDRRDINNGDIHKQRGEGKFYNKRVCSNGSACLFSRIYGGLLVFRVLFLIPYFGDLPEHADHQQVLSQLIEAAFYGSVEEEHIDNAVTASIIAAVDVRRKHILCRGGQW